MNETIDVLVDCLEVLNQISNRKYWSKKEGGYLKTYSLAVEVDNQIKKLQKEVQEEFNSHVERWNNKKINEKGIHAVLIEAGVKDISSWCSDLYVPVNDISRAIIDCYEFKCNVTKFHSQIDGRLCYDIPFAYDEREKLWKTE